MPHREYSPRGAQGAHGVETTADSAQTAAQAAARRSYGKLIAFLSARTHDVAGAEDALADAFEAALADWPRNGIPALPEAWLLTVARRKVVDGYRRRRRADTVADTLSVIGTLVAEQDDPAEIPDDRLRLMFACAHPAIAAGVRAPLMLQTILGFDAASIASAFLVAPVAMAQRLVRAKQKIQRAGIPFQVPDRDALGSRVEAVLDAVYTAFTEGWTDPADTEQQLRNLADEAIWLCRLLAALLPGEAEVLGLLALMLYAQARHPARRTLSGDYVPLGQQDTALWNTEMIEEADALLAQAGAMPGLGRYQIEAAVQSAHVVRRHTGRADWPAIVRLYDALSTLTDSPVVAINRAIALAEVEGAAAGLSALRAIGDDVRLRPYQPYWAALALLSAQAGQRDAADAAYAQAIGLAFDPAVRRFLQMRRAELP